MTDPVYVPRTDLHHDGFLFPKHGSSVPNRRTQAPSPQRRRWRYDQRGRLVPSSNDHADGGVHASPSRCCPRTAHRPRSPAGRIAGEAGSGPAARPGRAPRSTRPHRREALGRSSILWSDLDKSTKWAKEAINYVGADERVDARLRAEPRRHVPVPAEHDRDPQVLRPGGRDGARAHRDRRPDHHVRRPGSERRVLPRGEHRREAPLDEEDRRGNVRAGQAGDDDHGASRARRWRSASAPAIKSLNRLHTADGTTFTLPANFGALILGMRLGPPLQQLQRSERRRPHHAALARAGRVLALSRGHAALVERPVADRAVPGHRAAGAHAGPGSRSSSGV